MKPAPFRYHAPERVDEAVALLAEHGDDAKALAGGQSLVPILSLRLSRFEHIVDLNRITALRGVEQRNGTLRVNAMVRQAEAEHSKEVAQSAPLLSRALPHIGHFQIRNRGTVGGSTAHADPASELPAVALALEATIEATGASGVRKIAAADFFRSTWETSLADGELLTAVEYPVWSGRTGFAVEEIARRHGDFALCGACVGVQVDGAKVTKASIAMFGVGSTAVRAAAAESALVSAGSGAGESQLAEVGRLAAEGLDPPGDVHASGDYRKKVAAVVVARALTKALQEALA